LDKNPMTITSDVLTLRKEIKNSAMANLELHYTEWSASYTPADPIHDSYHEAAFILQKIKQVGEAANSMSYWVFTDIFEEAGPRFTPFHGGFGLMNTQGIKKPAYFAYSFMNKLGETELLNNDSTSWACKNAKGDIQLLMWDFTYTLPDSVNNQQYYIRDLPAKNKATVKVEIKNVPEGSYQLETYKIGYQVNDAYTTYLSLNKPNQLSKQQVELIKSKNDGAPTSIDNIKISKSGLFTKELKIRENEVILFSLKRKQIK
jgi:xylan 1,4-beta-xylosidase